MTNPCDTPPRFSFGILADPQYADLDANPLRGRYYRNSLAKLSAAIAHMNGEDLAFVMTLGDVIDRDWASFDTIMPLYENLRHPRFFVAGNHDFAVAPHYLDQVHARLGMPAAWYDFSIGGLRFVALDGNEVSTFAPPEDDPRRDLAASRLAALEEAGAANAHRWNASISDEQFSWLEERLRLAETCGERVVVMGHYPVYPPHSHTMWDGERIASLLAASDCVAAYLCGHNHSGNYGCRNGKHFINFHGMVDTPDQNCFAIVDIHDDCLIIRGFGREESRILPL